MVSIPQSTSCKKETQHNNTTIINLQSWGTTDNGTNDDEFEQNVDNITNKLDSQFIDCPKFELQVGEFQIIKNHNNDVDTVVQSEGNNEEEVYIKRYNKKLGKGQYSIKENDKLVICAPYILENSSSIDHKNVGMGKSVPPLSVDMK